VRSAVIAINRKQGHVLIPAGIKGRR
jgi:hypothetical protein